MFYKYNQPQKYVTYNSGDKNLRPITLKLPSPPNLKHIPGFGKDPLDQVWERLEPSEKLVQLTEKALNNIREWAKPVQDRRVTEYRVQEEFWRLLEEEQNFYKAEIKFIKEIHWYLYHGYWLYIKGTPTWLPPTYFRYLNFWYGPKIPGHYPQYRDVDRRTYIFKWYCRTTNETLGNLDEKGIAKPIGGKYEVIKKENRTCFGHIKPKRRREGASNQECNDALWVAERTPSGDCVITADKGQSARDIYFDIMVPGFLNMPLWLKPIHNNTTAGSNKIELKAPDTEYGIKSIGSNVVFIETASEGGVDRMKIYNYMGDESAKLTLSDAYNRHEISKLTTAQYSQIHGYMAYPSTVEEMNKGGEAFKRMWNESGFYRRNPQGHTLSGLYRIFNPSWDGLDGYIDKWGQSVIDAPTEDQLKHPPYKAAYLDGKGAKDMILGTVNQLLSEGTPAAINKYRQFIRKHPYETDHCWIGTSGDMGWDIIKVDQRLADLSRSNEDLKRGNLHWIGNIKDNPEGVIFREDKLNGRFYVSDEFIGKQNLWMMTSGAGVWDEDQGRYVRAKMPRFPNRVTIGADPFDYGTEASTRGRESGSRKSDGGIHILLNYDPQIDADKSQEEWDTFTTIGSYRYRPPSESEYMDDVIKAAVYWGGMISMERNKTALWKEIIRRGYGGYLIYMVNVDGIPEKKPGVYTGHGLGDKNESFNKVGDYINFRIHKDKHPLLLNEIKDLPGPEKLTDNDLLAAFICSLIGHDHGHQRSFRRIGNRESYSIKGTSLSRKSIY